MYHYNMQATNRHNLRWNINEVLRLEREYFLLKMPVDQIAEIHERSVDAILFKLVAEEFVDKWESARGYEKSELLRGHSIIKPAMRFFDKEDDDSQEDEDEDEEYIPDEECDDVDDVDESLSIENERLQSTVDMLLKKIESLQTNKRQPLRKLFA